jgi:tetratricopeptide (TPR) repeat protein/transglutaminase-like putative cysteine protease
VRVRLGSAQGVARFGQIALPYVEGFGDAQFHDVLIDKANGRRVEVKGVVEDVNPFGLTADSTPADIRVKKLTVPGLEPGDTLSYRIVHKQSPMSAGRVFGEFKLPPLEGATQTYELDLPRAADIRVRLRDGLGASWEEVPAAPDRLLRRIVVQVDPPPDKAPDSKAERRKWAEPDVTFTSFRSWTEVTSWWWAMAKERLAPDAAVASEAAELTAGITDPRSRLLALFPLLASRIRYINVSFGLGRIRPRFAAEVLRDRYGDCKDKHTLLAALASSLGIDVRPVLINSVRDTLYDDVPGPQQFDHMISVARLGASPADWLWLDGTNGFGPPGYLAPGLRDKPALLVEPDGTAATVRTPSDPPYVSRWETTFKGAVDAEGVLRGHATSVLRSDSEMVMRAAFATLPRDQWPSMTKDSLADDLGEVTVRNVVVSDPADAAAPLRVEYDLEKKLAVTGGERVLALPLPAVDVPKPADPKLEGEPPVRFDVRERIARAEIELPEGQRARAPLSVSLERPFAAFRSTYSAEGRTVKAERTLTLPRSSLEEADLAAYQSMRDAVKQDGKQEFAIEGAVLAMGADGLRREGMAAFTRKDYATAAERLRQAGEADSQRKDVFEDLGRALYELKRNEEAVAAFARHIELVPYSETAYAWRAHALSRLRREEEAEKDLLKQIEVAPFKAWSYQRLGDRRFEQKRLAEAVDFYGRAAALEPKVAERWIDLGSAQAAAGQASEARVSLDRGVGLRPEPWIGMQAASSYRELGDVSRAGEVAAGALPALRERLGWATPEDFDESDLLWMERLIMAWTLVGEAAVLAEDLPRAQRYFEAAWEVGLSPEAGWRLGEVHEKQGRHSRALEIWRLAASVRSPAKLPPDRQARLDAVSRKLGARPDPFPDPALMSLRTISLAGPSLGSLTEEVLLLVGADGRVQSVSNLSRRDAKAFDRQNAKLGPIRIGWALPDAEPLKLVRRGLLACAAGASCALVLDLPGTMALEDGIRGAVEITSMNPARASLLSRGQQVTLAVTVRYRVLVDGAVATLVVQDQTGRSVVDPQVRQVLSGRSGDATLTATFTVPANATHIDVFVPVTGDMADSTNVVANARIRVRAR